MDGLKDGNPIRIDAYASAPGLVEAFESSGLSHEAYLTGQCAAVFAKMMVVDVFADKGLYVPEQFDTEAREYYFKALAKLGVTVESEIVPLYE